MEAVEETEEVEQTSEDAISLNASDSIEIDEAGDGASVASHEV